MRQRSEYSFSEHKNKIFSVRSSGEFNERALEIFHFQYRNNPVYKEYLDVSGADPYAVTSVDQIPFLPAEIFRNRKVLCKAMDPDLVFFSSGTAGMEQSKHYIADPLLYEESFFRSFRHFFGGVEGKCILGLLPSYLERQNSSLAYMIKRFIEKSGVKESGFFLYNYKRLYEVLMDTYERGMPVFLFGVSFALLDFSERFPMQFPGLHVIETGGMKGRRKEFIREELHRQLMKGYGVDHISSEYGMTELLSQAYAPGDGLFAAPPWMKIFIKDVYDPYSAVEKGKTGTISIVDLANVYSCSFIATRDLGKMHPDGRFEVLGRADTSDIRGCNLLVT